MKNKITISGKYIDLLDFERLKGDKDLIVKVFPKLSEMSETDVNKFHKEAKNSDLVIMCMFGSNPEKIKQLHLDEIKSPKAYWSFDSHHQWETERKISHFFDKMFISHSPYIKFFDQNKTEWLPCCYVRYGTKDLISMIIKNENIQHRPVDISFPHKPYGIGDREIIAKIARSILKESNIRFHIGPIESGEPYIKLISNSKIILNISLIDDLNIRNFEAWAFNRILLANRTPDHAKLCDLSESAIYFQRSLTNFKECVDYALEYYSKNTINTSPTIINNHLTIHRIQKIINSTINSKYKVTNINIPELKNFKNPNYKIVKSQKKVFHGHGNNIGVITLAKDRIDATPIFCSTRLQIEDNIGESIHIHWRNIRFDYSIKDFNIFCEGIKLALYNLKPKIHNVTGKVQLSEGYLHALADLSKSIVDAQIEYVNLKDLKIIKYVKDEKKVKWITCAIHESPVFSFLKGDYDNYFTYRKLVNDQHEHDPMGINHLCKSLLIYGYPRNNELIVLHGDELYIRDGQHRAAILYFFYGNISIPVVKLKFNDSSKAKINTSSLSTNQNYSLDYLICKLFKEKRNIKEFVSIGKLPLFLIKLISNFLNNTNGTLHIILHQLQHQEARDLANELAKLNISNVHFITGNAKSIISKWSSNIDIILFDEINEIHKTDFFKFNFNFDNNSIWISNIDSYYTTAKHTKQQNLILDNYQWGYIKEFYPNKLSQNISTSDTKASLVHPTKIKSNSINYNNILIVRTDSIGDNIIGSSIIPEIKKILPNATIDIACQNHIAPLYEHSPHIESILRFEKNKLISNKYYLSQFIKQIQSKVYNICINSAFSRDYISDIITLNSNSEIKSAFTGDSCNMPIELMKITNELYTNTVNTNEKVEIHRYKSLFEQIFNQTPSLLSPQVWVTTEDHSTAEMLLKMTNGKKFMAVFPGALHYHKQYPLLGEALNPFSEYTAVILGGKDALEAQNAFCNMFKGNTIKLAGKTTIREMIAIIRKCDFYIGSDSSGAHAACAVETPNIVILGGGHYGRFFPYSPLTSVIINPLSCYNCNWKCPYEIPHCIHDIHSKIVSWAINESINSKSESPRIFMQTHALNKSRDNNPRWSGQISNTASGKVIPVPKSLFNNYN